MRVSIDRWLLTPKANHYSASSSLKYRVAASVLQKNEGHSYVTNVNRRLGLSPGYFTERLAKIRDLQHKRRKAIASTFKAKHRRRLLKSKRQQGSTTNEVREGVTYSEGVNFQTIQPTDVQEIPSPSFQPSLETLSINTRETLDEVIFNIEATGLVRTSHIIQISAMRDDIHFNQYILPKQPICKRAEEITGIRVNGIKMYHNNIEVAPVPIKLGLSNFLSFLSPDKESVITGHNIISYDIPVLLNAFQNCGMVNMFREKVFGICDTLPLFKFTNPGLTSYSQVNLFKHFLGDTYQAHDSLQDVIALNKLLIHMKPSLERKESLTYSLDSAIKRTEHSMSTLVPLVDSKSISKGIARSIAFSGLSFDHLRLAFHRNGREGVEDVLKEDFNGKPRVTRSKKILASICDYFESVSAPEV